MSAIATHAYEPCAHPGRHGYDRDICDRCRLSVADRCHAVPAVTVTIHSLSAEAMYAGEGFAVDVHGAAFADTSSRWFPSDYDAAVFAIALAELFIVPTVTAFVDEDNGQDVPADIISLLDVLRGGYLA